MRHSAWPGTPKATTRDDAETRKQIEDFRYRASHHEKEIAVLEKMLTVMVNEFAATENAAANQRDRMQLS